MANNLAKYALTAGLLGVLLSCAPRKDLVDLTLKECQQNYKKPELNSGEKIRFNYNMTVPAKVNGKLANLAFDTGNPGHIILDSAYAESIGINVSDSIGKIKIGRVNNLKVGGVELGDIAVVIRPWYHDGSLGMDLLKRINWTIDLNDSTITFYNKNTPLPKEKTKDTLTISANTDKGYLVIDASLGNHEQGKWIVDLAHRGISLDTKLMNENNLKEYNCKPTSLVTVGGLRSNYTCNNLPQLKVRGRTLLDDIGFGGVADFSPFETHLKETIQGQLGVGIFKDYKYISFSGDKLIIQK